MREPRVITISPQTMITGILLVIGALLLFLLRDVLVTVFVATVLSAAIDPSITSLERRGLPRPIGLAIIMFLLIGGVAFLVVTFFPLIMDQSQQFLAHLPEIYRRNLDQLRVNGYGHIARAIEGVIATMSQSADGAVRGFFGGALSAVRGLMSLFGVIVLTLYMVMGQKDLKAGALELTAPRIRPRVSRLLREIKSRLGQWLRGGSGAKLLDDRLHLWDVVPILVLAGRLDRRDVGLEHFCCAVVQVAQWLRGSY